jgi:hypothetical protein
MKAPHFTIRALMFAVAVVAVNAAVARALWTFDPEALVGTALPIVALQGALFCIIRRPRSNRAFWIGFAALGALALVFFLWGRVLPEQLIAESSPGQPLRLINVSPVSAWWLEYGTQAGSWLEPWLGGLPILADPNGLATVAIRALVWSAPQLLVALAGGLIGLGFSKIARVRIGFPSRSPRGVAA